MERRFACPLPDCPGRFTTRTHLRRHTTTVHSTERPFHCQFEGCSSRFTRSDNLKHHERNCRHAPTNAGARARHQRAWDDPPASPRSDKDVKPSWARTTTNTKKHRNDLAFSHPLPANDSYFPLARSITSSIPQDQHYSPSIMPYPSSTLPALNVASSLMSPMSANSPNYDSYDSSIVSSMSSALPIPLGNNSYNHFTSSSSSSIYPIRYNNGPSSLSYPSSLPNLVGQSGGTPNSTQSNIATFDSARSSTNAGSGGWSSSLDYQMQNSSSVPSTYDRYNNQSASSMHHQVDYPHHPQQILQNNEMSTSFDNRYMSSGFAQSQNQHRFQNSMSSSVDQNLNYMPHSFDSNYNSHLQNHTPSDHPPYMQQQSQNIANSFDQQSQIHAHTPPPQYNVSRDIDNFGTPPSDPNMMHQQQQPFQQQQQQQQHHHQQQQQQDSFSRQQHHPLNNFLSSPPVDIKPMTSSKAWASSLSALNDTLF